MSVLPSCTGTKSVSQFQSHFLVVCITYCYQSLYCKLQLSYVMMSISSTMSVPLILMGDSSQKAVVFPAKLKRGHALSQVFMNPDIITGLVFQHMIVKPLVV